jgi:hypothetical protein
MRDRDHNVLEILKPYMKQINDTPVLISLLYDADMLPEQIVSTRGAISVAAVVEAYNAGRREPNVPELKGD